MSRTVYVLASTTPRLVIVDNGTRFHAVELQCPGCDQRHQIRYAIERSPGHERGKALGGGWMVWTCLDERLGTFSLREEVTMPCGARLFILAGMVSVETF